MTVDRDLPARLSALGAAALWGTTGTVQRLGEATHAPGAVGALRIAFGGVLLLAIAAVGSQELRRVLAILRQHPLAAALAAVGTAAYQVTFFSGVARAGVALGTVVALGSAPAITGALGRLFLGERPERGWVPATTLAIAGVALLLLPGREVSADAVGVAFVLGAGLSYSVYTLALKRLLDAGGRAVPTVALLFCIGAVLLLPFLVAQDLAWLGTGRGLAAAVWLGAGATAVAYLLFAYGLSLLRASTVATLTLAEPTTAAVLGTALLVERPGAVGLAGGGLVLAGLVTLVAGRRAVPADI
ncbi:MAG: DMT family transporter [Nitriliruptorales bacterium]